MIPTSTYETLIHGQLVTVKRYDTPKKKSKRARRVTANISDPARAHELALILGVDIEEEET